MRCIEYSGHIGNMGYGLDYDPKTKKTILAHRLVFRETYGYLPKTVMHSCDNRKCINPKHLIGGTQSENIKDCVKKGRYKFRGKLTWEQVQEIRKSLKSTRELGKEYRVNQKTISNVKRFDYIRDISGKGGTCGS